MILRPKSDKVRFFMNLNQWSENEFYCESKIVFYDMEVLMFFTKYCFTLFSDQNTDLHEKSFPYAFSKYILEQTDFMSCMKKMMT